MNEVCEVCGIIKLNENLYQPKVGKQLTSDSLKSLVCQFTNKRGCINQNAVINETSETWEKRNASY